MRTLERQAAAGQAVEIGCLHMLAAELRQGVDGQLIDVDEQQVGGPFAGDRRRRPGCGRSGDGRRRARAVLFEKLPPREGSVRQIRWVLAHLPPRLSCGAAGKDEGPVVPHNKQQTVLPVEPVVRGEGARAKV